MKTNKGRLGAGELVQVRSKEEILSTLDDKGRLDGMPFMPEMLQFCGGTFHVYKRAHKTCDTVFPIRGRRVESSVHLDTRCDGASHGDCQAGCLLFWKEAWLKSIDREMSGGLPGMKGIGNRRPAGCSEASLLQQTHKIDKNDGQPVYRCQATQLPHMTSELLWWDIRQYVEDYESGNVGLWQMFCGAIYSSYYNLSQSGLGLGRPMRWIYDRLRFLWKGSLFPRHKGPIPESLPTPKVDLNLQPGERVRVKPHKEILETLNTRSMNRGMYFDAEQVPYCEGTYTVLRRVTRIINEQTGKMMEMKTPCIVLDSVVCGGRYSGCRMFCPRAIYLYWREIWLERVEDKPRQK